MASRTAPLLASLALLALLAFLTVRDLVRNGVTPLMVVAVLILVFVGVGVVGALTSPPKE